MNEFSKLNRDQMRKITGGVPPVCNTENGCAFPNPPDIPYVGAPEGSIILFGICEETVFDGCNCVRRDAEGGLVYGPRWYCEMVD